MALYRWLQILKFITFDDKETRNERWQTDRGAAIREVFQLWNSNCSKWLFANVWITIDECLYSMRNKISFKTFNPNKPSKYGMLFRCVNEVLFSYTHRSDIYLGKPNIVTEDTFYEKSILKVVLRLLEGYGWDKLSGVNLTTDNYYTSIELANKLREKRMTLIGTMRCVSNFRQVVLLQSQALKN